MLQRVRTCTLLAPQSSCQSKSMKLRCSCRSQSDYDIMCMLHWYLYYRHILGSWILKAVTVCRSILGWWRTWLMLIWWAHRTTRGTCYERLVMGTSPAWTCRGGRGGGGGGGQEHSKLNYPLVSSGSALPWDPGLPGSINDFLVLLFPNTYRYLIMMIMMIMMMIMVILHIFMICGFSIGFN